MGPATTSLCFSASAVLSNSDFSRATVEMNSSSRTVEVFKTYRSVKLLQETASQTSTSSGPAPARISLPSLVDAPAITILTSTMPTYNHAMLAHQKDTPVS